MPLAHIDCPWCALEDPHERTRHHFDLMEQGLEIFRAHLEDAYKNHPGGSRNLPAIMEWAAGVIHNFSGMAHPDTGAPLPWRQGLRHFSDAYAGRHGPGAPSRWTRAGRRRELAALGPVMRALLPPPGDDAWAQCWIWLLDQGFARPGRERELAAECRKLADQYPLDQDDWVREADRIDLDALDTERRDGSKEEG